MLALYVQCVSSSRTDLAAFDSDSHADLRPPSFASRAHLTPIAWVLGCGRSRCWRTCGPSENREDGENPSRSRRCIRGRSVICEAASSSGRIAATVFNPLLSHIGLPIERTENMGRCHVRTIRESEDLPRQLRVGPRAVTCADWSVSRCALIK